MPSGLLTNSPSKKHENDMRLVRRYVVCYNGIHIPGCRRVIPAMAIDPNGAVWEKGDPVRLRGERASSSVHALKYCHAIDAVSEAADHVRNRSY